MGIFERIKKAIFGHSTSAQSTPGARAPSPAPAPASSSSAPAAAAAPAPSRAVDIEAVMREYESKSTQKLNWRTSIVDLLKLLDIDSSLENRKELAKELGYTGSTSDSASMNIWLHKQVLRKLQDSGGRVPVSLMD